MNKVLVSVIVAIIGICIFAQIGFTTLLAVESASGPIISVEPSYLEVPPGGTFTVNITVNPDGVEIGSAQYDLYFNSMLLNVIEQTQGPFLSQDGVPTNVIRNTYNNTIGKVEYGEYRVGDPDVIGGITTPGVLATITFKALEEPGTSSLSLSNVIVSNPYGVPYSKITNDGTVEIEACVFDTNSPENPYPSISGIHNGTIISDQPIVANGIYTYACPGTGGHAEFVRIWGNDVDAHATWSGYVDDWHNLTFNRTFTLKPGVEYNYTIRTGSYPQIHHPDTDELEAANGTITCTKFIDANGRTYNNWIPAIRLFL